MAAYSLFRLSVPKPPRHSCNLQFENIYRIRHVHHGISPADGTLHLCADIDIEEAEHQIEDGLIMLLAMILQIVWNCSQIGAHVFQSSLNIVSINRLAESQEKCIVVGTARIHIMRNLRIEQSIAYLLVWDAQRIFPKHRFIFLDGQVTALVKQRQGIRHFLRR